MSKYTTELRFVCEMASGFTEEELKTKSPEEVIRAARLSIFDFDFPIYDEQLREPLELKILRHFYTREIGVETVGLWKWRLNAKLNEIMPMYNKLYEAEYKTLNVNGIYNIDVTTDHDYTPGVLTKDKTTTEGESKDAYSDTPQNGLSDVEKLNYLTDYRNIKNGSTTTAERLSVSGMDKDHTHEFGYRGSKTVNELLKDFQDNIINIDQLIIMELNDLFFLLY